MFEAYRVGVRLTLINHVSHGLSAILTQFNSTGIGAKALQSELNKIKVLGIAGAATGALGFMGLGIIGKTITPAKEYVHQLALMNTAGMKQKEIVEATGAAWKALHSVPTSSVSENLEAIRDLRMVFGDTAHATQYMPVLQKVQGMLGTVRHGNVGVARNESYELAKALEMKGAVRNPNEFVNAADLMTKAIVATGGKVGATDYLSAFKYGRAATSGWNDDFTYKILPTLIQEMKTSGGSGGTSGGPGSALMSMYAAVVGGTITQRALKVWNDIGLVDPKKVVWSKDGHVKGVLPGGIKGSEEFQANPYSWVRGTLMPALAKGGFNTEAQQKQALQYLFPNRTAGFIASQFATQSWKFERDRTLIDQAKGLSGYDELLKTDPLMAQVALQKQWNSLLAILGFQLMPPLISGLTSLISVVRSASKFVQEHSALTKTLVLSFTGLSAALAMSGTVMMLTAGFKALKLAQTLLLPGLPALSAALVGKAGLVGAVAIASYAVGTMANGMINKFTNWATNGKNDSLGGWIWDVLHNKDGSTKYKSLWEQTGTVTNPIKTRSNGSKPIQVSTAINLDGRNIANVVTNHQSNELDKPQAGVSSFDQYMTLAPVSY